MNFEQLQLMEYAFYCVTELTTIKNVKRPKLVIKSDLVIFTAETFLVTENRSVEFRVPNYRYSMRYSEKYITFGEGNPFFEVKKIFSMKYWIRIKPFQITLLFVNLNCFLKILEILRK